ncbi:unnamed protein product [Porites evermanni]|uniref:Uncharacterized protein n=1 Tax=Porites evermanni TaxID=104178 RepID=A0ABN8PJQ4_9CNID|nr:unnamed protein product [Porites evermanni]
MCLLLGQLIKEKPIQRVKDAKWFIILHAVMPMTAYANDDPTKQKNLSKSLAVKIQKACRTRWLSTGQSVSSVCRNLLTLMQTLRQFKEADATAQGLLKTMNNTKFVGTMLLLNALQTTIQPGGDYASLELELTDDGQIEAFLKNLVVNYTTALERNLDRRFQEAAPVLETFSIFDPSCLPKPEDPAFKKYGVDEVKVLCKQFQFHKDHTLAQWYNFKYLMSS